MIRNHTARPLRLTIPFGQMETQPKIHPSTLAALLAGNRERVCTHKDTAENTPTTPPPEPEREEEKRGATIGAPELL